MSREIRDRIRKLEEQVLRIRREKGRLLARMEVVETKRDKHCKYVAGGAVLTAVHSDGVPPLESEVDLMKWLDGQLTRPSDRRAFGLPPKAARN